MKADQKLVEENLRLKHLSSKYIALYNSSPEMYVSVDPTTAQIIDCNATLCFKTGYSKEEIIGMPIHEIYHQSCLPDVKKAFDEFVSFGKVTNANLIIQKKNGDKIPVLLNVEAIRDEHGKILYSNSCWTDVSEIKKLESDLAKTNQILENKIKQLELRTNELEQFVSVASHDLRDPLASMSSMIELLKLENNGNLSSSSEENLGILSESAGRMRDLIDGLLDYSRIGKNRQLEMTNINDLVHKTQQDIKALIEKRKAQIEIQELPTLNIYPLEFRLLIQNLLVNAIKFARADKTPKIWIKANENETSWQFSVADEGIGIEPKNKEKIFNIFQRIDQSPSRDSEGIGLAHCRKIVKQHHGKIWVESKFGEGSTFHFIISKGLR